ncbi:hypothetical protein [Roseicella aquatilis]|uniref:Peptidase C39-like domain-containing protein n=1 Tax=Roseicella aquatilis TaxID=2527868 RepID=A0A4R4D8I6_9PROT|nr:hypothetical protein [Roseicella aquatilis]TCZ56628.1 hypothetical protein EXY23_19760 [Roseicella aquatilis]
MTQRYPFTRRAALLGGGALLGARPSRADTSCCGPITPAGQALAAFLDGTRVEQLWPAGWHVDWRSGQPNRPRPGGHEAATHCSAFVAAVALRLGIYVLRPPEHPQELLANAQLAWLDEAGPSQGWEPVGDMRQAQALANQGSLVLAAYRAPDPHRPGHIAVLRPSLKSVERLEEVGPEIIMAGVTNYRATTVAQGFRHHPGAWAPGGAGDIRYHAHAVDPQRLLARLD